MPYYGTCLIDWFMTGVLKFIVHSSPSYSTVFTQNIFKWQYVNE
jgi:hypothetical protein